MSGIPGHLVWVDGVDALFDILDGLPAGEHRGEQLRTRTFRPQGLPADLSSQVAAGLVAVCVYRGGWNNDVDRTDGVDSVVVDVYAPTSSMARSVQHGFEVLLVGNYFDTAAGFVDDVEIGSRFRDVPSPLDTFAQTSAAFRVTARPD